MRLLIVFITLLTSLYGDKDGNGKCWQREKIQELQHVNSSVKHVEYGSVILEKNGDTTDYYFFTPKAASHFDLIFSSNYPVNLYVGTSCKDADSLLSEKGETEAVLLDQDVKETIYIKIVAASEKLTSYEFHVNLTLNGEEPSKQNYNTNFGSHFDCQLIDGNVVCKR
jgi:hypothetical protein